jgi:Ulp1 family protease
MNFGDEKRLIGEYYLNDNIIDFRIKYFLFNNSFENISDIYAFSCQFYTRLLQVKDHREAYKLVAGWTKAFDLFAKKFIFIPINLDKHWSLFIIVRPDLVIAKVYTIAYIFYLYLRYCIG